MHVLTRAPGPRAGAVAGCASAGDAADAPPEPLDAAILFAPVGDLVPVALAALDRGGTLAVAGIHLSDIPALNYERHLFEERVLRSVTANTRATGASSWRPRRASVRGPPSALPFEEADHALSDLAHDRVNGAAVLVDFPLGRPTGVRITPGVSESVMAMREECKHFQSRTYSSGEVARFCVLGNAPDQPWSCPENCMTYERRLADVGWVHGTLVRSRWNAPPETSVPIEDRRDCSTRRATSSTPSPPT